MPSGKTHLKIESLLLLLWTGALAPVVLTERVMISQALLFVGSYVFSMFWMSPDLDLSNSVAFYRWGALRWFWLPYVWIFRHRQTSHHPLYGPLSRIIYIGILALAVALIYAASTGNPVPQLRISIQGIIPVCLGLYLPNLEHILADRISTSIRRRRSKSGL